MLLIATDEAGYGPQLGPLVVVSSAWRIEFTGKSGQSRPAAPPVFRDDLISEALEGLRQPIAIDGKTCRIDDSKRLYSSGKPLGILGNPVAIAAQWCGLGKESVQQFLKETSIGVSSEDQKAIPVWVRNPAAAETDQREWPLIPPAVWEVWRGMGASDDRPRVNLVSVVANVIFADQFNRKLDEGRNKATLLAEAGIENLAELLRRADALQGNCPKESAAIYCDRLGGRRYYAGILSHGFPNGLVTPIQESSSQSTYRIWFPDSATNEDHKGGIGNPEVANSKPETEFCVRYTVKGDRFPPVAYSSIIAKWIREIYMRRLNRFFSEHHSGRSRLKPTAGYPVDAKRFLVDIEAIRKKLGIDDDILIRKS